MGSEVSIPSAIAIGHVGDHLEAELARVQDARPGVGGGHAAAPALLELLQGQKIQMTISPSFQFVASSTVQRKFSGFRCKCCTPILQGPLDHDARLQDLVQHPGEHADLPPPPRYFTTNNSST